MPRDGEIALTPKAKGRRKPAGSQSRPFAASPASSPIGTSDPGVVGDGHLALEAQLAVAIPELVRLLAFFQNLRKATITAISRDERSSDSMLVQVFSDDPAYANKDRKALFSAAKVLRTRMAKEGAAFVPASWREAAVMPTVEPGVATAAFYAAQRKQHEAKITELAMQLPVWPWVRDNVRGLGALGLGVLAAEARIPIGDYRTVSGFWKHMALSVESGRAQRLPERGKVEVAGEIYNKRRRAEVWVFCSDTMLRAQWRADRDEDGNAPAKSGKPTFAPAHALGRYGEVYARRKAHTAPRIAATADLPDKIGGARNPEKWTPGRCDADARRVMTKELLKDLWVAWREASKASESQLPVASLHVTA